MNNFVQAGIDRLLAVVGDPVLDKSARTIIAAGTI